MTALNRLNLIILTLATAAALPRHDPRDGMPEPDFARPGPLRRGPRRGHAVRHDLPAWNATDVVAAPSRPLNDTSAPVAFFGVPKAATRSFIQDATNIFGAELATIRAVTKRGAFETQVLRAQREGGRAPKHPRSGRVPRR